MAVFSNATRRRVDRISAGVGAVVFLLGIAAVAWGSVAPAAGEANTTVVSSPIPGDPVTQTVQTTEPVVNPTREPRVTTEVTTTAGTGAGSVVVTTAPAPAPFLGSTVSSTVFQVILVALLALLLAFATQRMLLGEYGIRRPALAVAGDGPNDLIGSEEVDDVKRDVVGATEQRDATRPLFDVAGVPDPRLRLLQSRIALEVEVRKLAQDAEVASNLSIPAVVKGLVERKRMTPRLAGAVVALGEFGDRLSRGADLSVDTMTTLTEAYAQALAKVGGKIRAR